MMHFKLSGLQKAAWVTLLQSYFLAFSFPFSPIVVSLPNICEFHGDEVMLLIDLPIKLDHVILQNVA